MVPEISRKFLSCTANKAIVNLIPEPDAVRRDFVLFLEQEDPYSLRYK
jgi:hypothetical protein